MGLRGTLILLVFAVFTAVLTVLPAASTVGADPSVPSFSASSAACEARSKSECGDYCYFGVCEECSTAAGRTFCSKWRYYIHKEPDGGERDTNFLPPVRDPADSDARGFPYTPKILPFGGEIPQQLCTDEEGDEIVQPRGLVTGMRTEGQLLTQIFTTGGNSQGYDLRAVSFPITGIERETTRNSDRDDLDIISVQIREYRRRPPSSADPVVGRLSAPRRFKHGFNRFSAHGVHLDPAKRYYLRIEQGLDPAADIERAVSPQLSQGPQAFGWSLYQFAFIYDDNAWIRYPGPVRVEFWGRATGMSQAAIKAALPPEGRHRWKPNLLVFASDSAQGVVDQWVVPNPDPCDDLKNPDSHLKRYLDDSGAVSSGAVNAQVRNVQHAEEGGFSGVFNCGWDVWNPTSTSGG